MTQTERIEGEALEVFEKLYYKGFAISQIQELARNLIAIGERALENPLNTIGAITNGKLIIK